VSHGFEGRIRVLMGAGAATLQNPLELVAPGATGAISTADLTGDGRLELIATLPDREAIQVLRGR
jgi:hypothetical protein